MVRSLRGQFSRFKAAIWRFFSEIGRNYCREAGSAEFSFVSVFLVARFAWTRLYEVRGGTYLVPCRLLCGRGGVGRVMTRLVHDLCINALSGEACA